MFAQSTMGQIQEELLKADISIEYLYAKIHHRIYLC